MNFGFVATLIIAFAAVTTVTDAQIGTLLPRADALTDGQPFRPFLEDVVQKTKFEQACESSQLIWQLDSASQDCKNVSSVDGCKTCAEKCAESCPVEGCKLCASTCGDLCKGQSEQNATAHCGTDCAGDCDQPCCQIGFKISDNVEVTEQFWEETDSMVATLPDSDWVELTPCPSCPQACESTTDQYCKQMAGLLAVTLNGSQTNPEAQRRAIEAALKMVAENAQAQSAAKTARLELNYEKSLIQLQQQVVALTQREPPSTEQFKAWLDPIYSTQQHNVQQILRFSSDLSALKKSVGIMGQRIAKLSPASSPNESQVWRSPQPQSINNRFVDVAHSHFDRAAYEKAAYEEAEKREIENLRRQIQRLDQQLEVLTKKPVRQAEHLVPIFTPDRPLEPLHYDRKK
jgi:hypothetical protein